MKKFKQGAGYLSLKTDCASIDPTGIILLKLKNTSAKKLEKLWDKFFKNQSLRKKT
jgi:hypothetical protein